MLFHGVGSKKLLLDYFVQVASEMVGKPGALPSDTVIRGKVHCFIMNAFFDGPSIKSV